MEEYQLVPATNAHTTQPKWGFFNVIIMGVAFLLLLSGFNTSSSYLTTALPENVGFYSLSILYATFALSNFVSAAFVKKFGPRFSMIFAAVLYIVFIAATVKIIVPLYLISSSLCGFGAAILWTAQGSFLTQCSETSKVSFHTGLFFAIFQVNSILGYLVVGVLVSHDENFATIFSVLFLIAASGVAALFALRKIDTIIPKKRESIKHLLLSTSFLFKDPKILAMFTLILYSGMSASFFVGVFPKSMGKQRIAWAQMCFGVAEVIGSFATGQLSGVVGRVPIFAFMFIAHMSALNFVYWSQYYPVTAVYFLATTMFGLGDSALQTVIYSVLANLYPDRSESAFAYYKFSQSVGYTTFFLVSIPLQHTLSTLVTILGVILLAAIVGMMILCCKLVDVDKSELK